MQTIIIATRNQHKVGEIQTILGRDFHYLTLRDLPGAPEVVEDAPTFAGNATKKARELAHWIASGNQPGLTFPAWVLADDSGLEVDALKGAPGVHSARFAALEVAPGAVHRNSPDAENNAKLLHLLKEVPVANRTARFRCVIAFVGISAPGAVASEQTFDGACEGRMQYSPTGASGFGYDPLFLPHGYHQSFAELGEDIKNQLSHRARALEKLRAWMKVSGV